MTCLLNQRRAGAVLGMVLLFSSAIVPALDLSSRQHLVIVGSSTAFPIISAAVERFARAGAHGTPVVESSGTGGGFKQFCGGIGLDTPDITMASRRIKATEEEQCRNNGVSDVLEIQIGYDGIAVANARGAPSLALTTMTIYLALAREVPDPAGRPQLVPNPYKRWSDIDPALPDVEIRVLGPPPTSGTRDILVERVLEGACNEVDFLRAMRAADVTRFRLHCHALREDGAYIETGENDAKLVRKLVDDPAAVGILGYNFVDRNPDKLQTATINGVAPELEPIESGTYPLSRPLFLYVKKAHLASVPAIAPFVRGVSSEEAWGEEGYLVQKGLIPMSPDDRARWSASAARGLDAGVFPGGGS